MQSQQPVARHGGIEMVIGMVVHEPVHKRQSRIQIHGATAQPEVRDIARQPRVLGFVAQPLKPPAVEGSERDNHRQHPQLEVERHPHESRVPDQQHPCPTREAPALLEARAREQVFFPLTPDVTARVSQRHPQRAYESRRVDERELKELSQGGPEVRGDLQIIGRIERELVMLGVAGPEERRVVPAQKADQVEKEAIQEARREDRAVIELMKGVAQESPAGAVHEKRHHRRIPRPVSG